MRRYFLTLLALITGLAAIGTPASAAMGELLGAQVQTGSQNRAEEKREECRIRKERERSPVKREDARDCIQPKPLKIYVPTAMFGIDRAYE